MPLTQDSAEKIKPSDKRREISAGSGLFLCVQPSGHKSWIIRYRNNAGRNVKMTLGNFDKVTLKNARDAARVYFGKVAQGLDPHREKVEARRAAQVKSTKKDPLFSKAVDDFLEACEKKGTRDRTLHEYRRMLRKDVEPRWRGRRISEITRQHVLDLLDDLEKRGAGTAVNRTFQVTRTLFGWAMSRNLLAFSPCAGVKAPVTEQSRDRVLSDDELHRLWQSLDATAYPAGPIIKLLLLTGARRSEIEGLRWSELLEDQTWLLPAERSKNGEERLTPLSDAALDVIKHVPRIVGDLLFTVDGEKPFASMQAAKKQLDAELRFNKPWVLHDLRRTVSTGLHRMGIEPHVCEAVLGHRVVHGVARVYNRWSYFPEKKKALDAWGKFVVKNGRRLKAVS
jgi:integrase